MRALLIALTLVALAAAAQAQTPARKDAAMSHRATGQFDVKVAPLDPYDKVLSRFSLDKQYHGDLEAVSKGEMLSSGNPATDAGAVAMEKVSGKLGGRSGSFVLQHSATMEQGKPSSWSIIVVPGSGTGELAGIRGKMEIVVEGGKHSYVFEYALP
jgi:Protein of unknown function (DUF3224)